MKRAGILLLTWVILTGCLGKGLEFDEQRLRTRCALGEQVEVTRQQALCIAKLAGLKEKRKCPFEIEEGTLEGQGPFWGIRESCSGIGIHIDRATGAIVGVEYGEVSAP
jgi:hypothetical protein